MGLSDRLTFEEGLAVEFPNIGADPFEIIWQIKSLTHHQPMLEQYKVTPEGRLLKEGAEYGHVPEEERSGHNEEMGGFETEIERARRSMWKIHQGWLDTAYHGIFEFHRIIDCDYVSLDAKFTDGDLVEISRNK